MKPSAYTEECQSNPGQAAELAESSKKKTLGLASSKLFMENLAFFLPGMWTNDSDLQLKATNFLHQMLNEPCPPIDDIVRIGVVPRLVQFLSRHDFTELQIDAAWLLTNIAFGKSENTKAVVERGAVPMFIQLLSSVSEDVREHAARGLANIAGDSPLYRDLVLNHNAMMHILSQFNEHTSLSMMKSATWTLSNFCRGNPQPSFEQIKPALPVLERLLQSTDEKVLTKACWALAYMSDHLNNKIHAVIDPRIILHLIKLLSHSSCAVLIPAVRAIKNIVTGDDDQTTQRALDHQVLPRLLNLLTNTYEKIIKKETCWTLSTSTSTLSNSTGAIKNTNQQIQTMIEEGIIQTLVWVLQTVVFKVKKEAAWVISNATCSGTHDQIRFMVKQGCIKLISDLLTSPDQRILTVCLEALENILAVGEAEKNSGHTGDDNLYALKIDEAKGLEKIENLQSHDNRNIYQKAAKILESFWTEDNSEEGNDENHAMHTDFGSSAESDFVMVENSGSEEQERSCENRWGPISWFYRQA